jgi:hypothetical protein
MEPITGLKLAVAEGVDTAVAGVSRVITLFSAIVEVIEQVDTPEVLVIEQALTVFAVPAALSDGVMPAMRLLYASFKVTVTVTVLVPLAAAAPLTERVLFAVAGPAIKLFVAVKEVRPLGLEILTVFVSAVVVESVQVETPVTAFEALQLVEFADPDTARVGVTPPMAFEFASSKVTVTVAVSVLSATGVPAAMLIVEALADAASATKVLATLAKAVSDAGAERVTCFVSAFVDLRAHVETPVEPSLATQVTVLRVPLTESEGVVEIGLP